MSKSSSLHIIERSTLGTGSARALRKEGRIPAVIFGKDFNQQISVDFKVFNKEYHQPGFFTCVFDLAADKGKAIKAIVKDVQFDPVTDNPIHVDFQKLDANSKVTVAVPIELANSDQSPGVKRGGLPNMVIHDLMVTCAANNIVDKITIDLTGMEIHDSVHVKDLKLPKGAVAKESPDATVVTIVAPTLKVETEATEEPAAQ